MGEELKIEMVSIKKLIFDPENPRLPSKLRGYDKEKEIIEWMILYENIIELMGSIGEKGYFLAEPLFVVNSSKKKGFYEVVEGNRRLAAVKLLNTPSLATIKKQSINEVIFEAKKIPADLPIILFNKKDDVLIYLGYRHITGIKEWDSLAKAKYLEVLRNNLKIKNKKEEYKTLAKIIGTNPSYVKSILSGLKVFQAIEEHRFFDIEGLDEINVEFGVLYTAAGRRNISTFIGIDLEADDPAKGINLKHLKELTTWMFEKNSEGFTRLGESRNIKDLDKVIASSNALKAFRSGRPLSEAVLYTSKPSELFAKSIERSFDNLKIARDQMHNIELPDEKFLNTLDEIVRISADLKKLIKVKISG